MRTALLVVLCIPLAGCSKRSADRDDDPRSRSETRRSDPGPIVEAADLSAAFKVDSVAASAKYSGKLIRVRIRVTEVDPQEKWVWVEQHFGDRWTVLVRIPSRYASRLSKGISVVVVSKIDDTIGHIALIDTEDVTIE